MRVLVIGAGVIGQVYAGRLADAKHPVTLLARGDRFEALKRDGVVLTTNDEVTRSPVKVVDAVSAGANFDAVLVAVRADQWESALAVVETVRSPVCVIMSNVADRAPEVVERVGSDRAVLGYPGLGGEQAGPGLGIRYAEVRQQHTTIGRNGGLEQPFVQALRDAGFKVDEIDDMPGWLATHAVFVAGVGAAILAAGGDSERLGRDRRCTLSMVNAVGEGFRALEARGITVGPPPLRNIFTRVPLVVSVPYWQRLMRGPVGVQTMTPHVRATRHTEFPALVNSVRRLVGHSASQLEELFRAAGV